MITSSKYDEKYQDGIYSSKRKVGKPYSHVPSISSIVSTHFGKNEIEQQNGFFSDDDKFVNINKEILEDDSSVIGQSDYCFFSSSVSFEEQEKKVFTQQKQVQSSNEINNSLDVFDVKNKELDFPFKARGMASRYSDEEFFGNDINSYSGIYKKTGENFGIFTDCFEKGTNNLNKLGVPQQEISTPLSNDLSFFDESKDINLFVSESLIEKTKNEIQIESSAKYGTSYLNSVGLKSTANSDDIGVDSISFKYDFGFDSSGHGQKSYGDNLSQNNSIQNVGSNFSIKERLKRESVDDVTLCKNKEYKKDLKSINSRNYDIEYKRSFNGSQINTSFKKGIVKESAIDLDIIDVGVDSITTTQQNSNCGGDVYEDISPEIYERGFYNIIDTLNVIKIDVSSSWTPNIINTIRAGSSPYQKKRSSKSVKIPFNTAIFDAHKVPIDSYNIIDVDPTDGDNVFDPQKQVVPRVFVPEHYITGSTDDLSKLDVCSNPYGGKNICHWEPHSCSFAYKNVILPSVTQQYYNTLLISSSFWNPTHSSTLCNSIIYPNYCSLSEVNDYFYRINEPYSISHKQVYDVDTSGRVNSVKAKDLFIYSAYEFDTTASFYSPAHGGSHVDFYMSSSLISANTLKELFYRTNMISTSTLALPFGVDLYNTATPDYSFFNNYETLITRRAFDESLVFSDSSKDNSSKWNLNKNNVVLNYCKIDLSNLNLSIYTSSIVNINFKKPFNFEYFLSSSYDYNTNNSSYKLLFDNICYNSSFDGKIIPINTSLCSYALRVSGTADTYVSCAGDDDYSIIFNSFVYSTDRTKKSCDYDNFGDVTNFPNAMVIPGVRPYREDRNIISSTGTSGNTYTDISLYNDPTYPGKFFIGDDNGQYKVEDEIFYANQSSTMVYDNDLNIGIEGFYGYKNYINNQSSNNFSYYDIISKDHQMINSGQDMLLSYPGIYDTSNDTNAVLYASGFLFPLILNDFTKYVDSYPEYKSKYVSTRVKPDSVSDYFYTIFLQYPKCMMSSTNKSITYSFKCSGDIYSDPNMFNFRNFSNFNDTSVKFLLMSESKELSLVDSHNCVYFPNNNSNFSLMVDFPSDYPQEYGKKSYLDYNNYLTNSIGNFDVRASLTDRRWYGFAAISGTTDTNITKYDYFPTYLTNKAQIGIACSASVVSQFGLDIETNNGYDSCSGTLGYFTFGPIDQSYNGTIKKAPIENCFSNLILSKTFDWVAGGPMVASQCNFGGAGTIMLHASCTKNARGFYPEVTAGEYIKSDAFVNLPVLQAAFSKVQTKNLPFKTNDEIPTIPLHITSTFNIQDAAYNRNIGNFACSYNVSGNDFTLYYRRFDVEPVIKNTSYYDKEYINEIFENMFHSHKKDQDINYAISNKDLILNFDTSFKDTIINGAITGSFSQENLSSSMVYQNKRKIVFMTNNYGLGSSLLYSGPDYGYDKEKYEIIKFTSGTFENNAKLPMEE